jgi:hypothetical protein
MTVLEFKDLLAAHPDKRVLFALPDGERIPEHYHVTEIGHVRKNFVDCGGTRRSLESCQLQAWVADDTAHRLDARKLKGVFAHASDVLPHEDLPVEVEFEARTVSQFPVLSADAANGNLVFQLGLKHTDCLAKELCLPNGCGSGEEDSCCAGEKSSCCG